MDYSEAKIYRLLCQDGHYYIGSTCSPLQIRLGHHRYSIRNNLSGAKYSYFSKVPLSQISIELVESFPCETKSELLEREDYYIKAALDDTLCLNTHRAYLTQEQKKEYDRKYYNENKEYIQEQQKQYYEENKETILEQHQQYLAKPEIQEKTNEYHAKYREENAEKRRAYSKQYVIDHPEEVKEARKQYYNVNKEKITNKNKEYVEKNKEKVKERKKAWAEKKKLEEAPKREEEQKKKKEEKMKRKEENKLLQETPVKCECGGTYQPYRKSRHDKGKKHISFTTKKK